MDETHLFLFLAPGRGDGDRGRLRDIPSGALIHLRLVTSTGTHLVTTPSGEYIPRYGAVCWYSRDDPVKITR